MRKIRIDAKRYELNFFIFASFLIIFSKVFLRVKSNFSDKK